MGIEKCFLDPTKSSTEELALVFLENGVAEKRKRVSPYSLRVDRLGKPLDFKYDCSTDVGRIETQATVRLFDILKRNKFAVWFSPKGGSGNYPEDRMTVVWVENRTEEMAEIKGRGIYTGMENERLVEAANRMLRLAGEDKVVDNSEELRASPVPLVVGEDQDWVEVLREIIPELEDVWEVIDQGSDEDRKREAIEALEEIVAQAQGRVSFNGGSNYSQLEKAVWLQQQMGLRGFGLLDGGPHGYSPMGLLKRRTLGMGIFDQLFGGGRIVMVDTDHRLEKCPKCHNYYIKKKKKCPICERND